MLDAIGAHADHVFEGRTDTAGRYEGAGLRSMIERLRPCGPSVIAADVGTRRRNHPGDPVDLPDVRAASDLQLAGRAATRAARGGSQPSRTGRSSAMPTTMPEMRAMRRAAGEPRRAARAISRWKTAPWSASCSAASRATTASAESVIDLGGYEVATSEGVRATETSCAAFGTAIAR